jgi:hypothetical protein
LGSPQSGENHDVHLVVFDANVYLDVARLVGEPFSWTRFNEIAAQLSTVNVPHPTDRANDSLRAIATTMSGRFVGVEPLQVWTSDHIDNLVGRKASQQTSAQIDEDRGLGWSEENAESLVYDLVGDLVFLLSKGESVGEVQIAYASPPLSHEDGCVYRTVEAAGSGSIFYRRYCVTRDKDFRTARLPGDITVLYPWEWVEFVRKAKNIYAASAMRGVARP